MITDKDEAPWSLLQKIFVVPAALVILLLILRILNITIPSTLLGLVLGSSLLAFAGSIAMMFVQPEAKQWRKVALINGIPYLFLFLFVGLLQLSHS